MRRLDILKHFQPTCEVRLIENLNLALATKLLKQRWAIGQLFERVGGRWSRSNYPAWFRSEQKTHNKCRSTKSFWGLRQSGLGYAYVSDVSIAPAERKRTTRGWMPIWNLYRHYRECLSASLRFRMLPLRTFRIIFSVPIFNCYRTVRRPSAIVLVWRLLPPRVRRPASATRLFSERRGRTGS